VRRRCGFRLENLAVPAARIWPRVEAALERSVSGTAGLADRRLFRRRAARLALAGVLAQPAPVCCCSTSRPRTSIRTAPRPVRKAVDAVLAETGATLVLIEHRVAESLDLVDRVVVLSPTATGRGRPDGCSPTGVRTDRPPVWCPAYRWPAGGRRSLTGFPWDRRHRQR